MSKSDPGNANLLIGVSAVRQPANQEIGVPGWHSRGYIPHFDGSDVTQHVTFHLADSLPKSGLLRLESKLKNFTINKRDAERRKRVDAWVDAGHGSCVLRKPKLAQMAQESLLTFDSERYLLLAWVVMPNHVHVLFQPIQGWTVARIVTAWKKFTARKICDDRQVSSGTPIWHREYCDRYIRDQAHLEQVIQYIHMNPVKAHLVSEPEKWRWSSAYPGNAHSFPSRGPRGMNLLIGVSSDS
jgi:REP element-mobilizing transposase RayT